MIFWSLRAPAPSGDFGLGRACLLVAGRVLANLLLIGLVISAATACSGDSKTSASTLFTEVEAPKVVVRIIAGDKQLGVQGDTLQPIIALVTDLNGVPQRNVAVAWSVNDNGSIRPLSPVTDDAGH